MFLLNSTFNQIGFVTTHIILFSESPYRILATKIRDEDILDEFGSEPAPFGSYCPPKVIRARIPSPLGPLSHCLLDFVTRVVENGPSYLIFAKKTNASLESEGWVLNYSGVCEVVDVSKVDPSKTRKKDRARQQKQPSKRTPEVEDTDVLGGGDIPSETETVLEGEHDCPSEDEYVAALNKSNVAETTAVSEMISRSLRCVSVVSILIYYGSSVLTDVWIWYLRC